jgi:hypothetical protein
MSKTKVSKKNKKASQFAIRVDKSERDAFVTLCEAKDTSAAREIRRFMRDWVAANTPQPAASTAEAKAEPDVQTTVPADAPGPAQPDTKPDAKADADTKPKQRRKSAGH